MELTTEKKLLLNSQQITIQCKNSTCCINVEKIIKSKIKYTCLCKISSYSIINVMIFMFSKLIYLYSQRILLNDIFTILLDVILSSFNKLKHSTFNETLVFRS